MTPTWLYVKTHVLTGMLYLGKTVRDPEKYLGSGVLWRRHIRKHGTKHVFTIWKKLFTEQEELNKAALEMSRVSDVLNSPYFMNLIPENGLDGGGGIPGKPLSEKNRKALSEARKGMKLTEQHRLNIGKAMRAIGNKPPSMKGKVMSEEQKRKISLANKGRKRTLEQKQRISEGHKRSYARRKAS